MATPHTERRRKVSLTLDLEHVNGEETVPVALAPSPSPQRAEPEPERWSLGLAVTYGAFFFAGASSIAMWSAITLCLDFFTQKYPDNRVGFVFPVVNMSSLLVISLYMVLAGRQWPLAPRVHGSLASYLVFVVVLPFVNISSQSGSFAYLLTILTLMGSTISASVLQSSMYGLAGVFGPLFIQALDGGKGFGAMMLFAFRLGLKWYYERRDSAAIVDPADAAKLSMGVFFGVAFWMVAMAWALYVAMQRTQYARPLMKEYDELQNEAAPAFAEPVFSPMATPMTGSPRKAVFRFPSVTTERSPLLRRGSFDRDSEASTIERVGRGDSTAFSISETDIDVVDGNADDAGDGVAFADMDESAAQRRGSSGATASSAAIATVFRTAAKPFFTLFLSFFVCLSCFPGIISAIPSTTLQLADWYPIVLVGCYNLGDLVGKNLPVRVMYFDITTLHLPWLLQLAFLPFFLAALLQPLSDVVVILATLSLGLVTGYVATSSMILAPSVCADPQKELAGMIAALCAIIGLCAGSYSGLALETLVQLWQDAHRHT